MSDPVFSPAAEGEIEPTMDPITYRQVYLNAKAIANMLKDFGGDISNLTQWFTNINNDITQINQALGDITDPDKPGIEPSVEGTGDVRGKLPDLSVIGLHALTDKIDENLMPSAYNRLVTYEIKLCNVVGVNALKNVTSTKCILQTWAPASQEITDIKAFQIAYANSGLAFTRYAAEDGSDAWGEWETGPIGGSSSSEEISDSEPADQDVGGWWLQPITGSPAD